MMKRSIVTLAGVLTAGGALADVRAGSGGEYGHMMSYGYDGFGFIMGPVVMLLVLAALVVGIVAMIRWMQGDAGVAKSAALDTLDLRFANGEIDAKEYAERKKLLIS